MGKGLLRTLRLVVARFFLPYRIPPIENLRDAEETWARQFVFYMQATGAGLIHDPTTLGAWNKSILSRTGIIGQFMVHGLKWLGHDEKLYGIAYVPAIGKPARVTKEMIMRRALAIEFPRCVEVLHG